MNTFLELKLGSFQKELLNYSSFHTRSQFLVPFYGINKYKQGLRLVQPFTVPFVRTRSINSTRYIWNL